MRISKSSEKIRISEFLFRQADNNYFLRKFPLENYFYINAKSPRFIFRLFLTIYIEWLLRIYCINSA